MSGGGEVIDAFNAADLLVTDVSSLVVDWLPTGRPLLVTRLPESVEEDSRALRSVARLSPGDDLSGTVQLALETEVEQAERDALVGYYLGGVSDPMAMFVAACREVLVRHEAAVAEAAARRERRRG